MNARRAFVMPLCALLLSGAVLCARAVGAGAAASPLEFRGEKTFRYEGAFAGTDTPAASRGFEMDQELRFSLFGEPAPGMSARIEYDDRERERFRALRFAAETERIKARLGDLEGPVTPFRLFLPGAASVRGVRVEGAGETPHALFLASGVGKSRVERFPVDGREGAYFLPDREILPGARVAVGGRELAPNEDYAIDLENGLLTFVEEPPPGAECRVDYRIAAEGVAARDFTLGLLTGTGTGDSGLELLLLGAPGGESAPLVGLSQRAPFLRRGDARVELLAAPPREDAPVAGLFGYDIGFTLPGGGRAALTGKRGGALQVPAPLALADDFRRLELPGPRLGPFATVASLHESAAGRALDLALDRADRAARFALRREEKPEAGAGGTTRSDLRLERTIAGFRTETRFASSLPDSPVDGVALGTVDLSAQGSVRDVLTRFELGRRDAGGSETLNGRVRARKRLSGRTALATEWSGRIDDAGASSLAESRAGASIERTLSRRLKGTADLSGTAFRDRSAGIRTKGWSDLALGWKYAPRPRMEILQGFLARRGEDATTGGEIRRDEARLSLRVEPVRNVEMACGGSLARAPGGDGGRRLDGEVAWRFRGDAKLRAYARNELSGTFDRADRGLDITALFRDSLEGAVEVREEVSSSPLLRGDVVERRGGFRLTARM